VNRAEARRRCEAARVARLATWDISGRLHLVPICFVLDDAVLYSAVDDKPKRSTALRRLANVRANPDVCILADEYDEDWSALWWVRLRGRGRVVTSGRELQRAHELLSSKYAQYRDVNLGAVLAVDIDHIRGWSAGSERGADAREVGRARQSGA
jgi:PPOX class probable F420-dependent enzyme